MTSASVDVAVVVTNRRPTPQYNLSLEEAIAVLDQQVLKNRQQTEDGITTENLQGLTPDEAYDVGYETLLFDLKSLTGPDPFEVEVVTYPIPEEKN